MSRRLNSLGALALVADCLLVPASAQATLVFTRNPFNPTEREVGFAGTAISSDGKLVLGSLGGFEPGPSHKVVSIPYKGGRPKVLANNASEPDWNR